MLISRCILRKFLCVDAFRDLKVEIVIVVEISYENSGTTVELPRVDVLREVLIQACA